MNEAIPYAEFKQNPYAVLCTTSLGGHLSWFEFGNGGQRWHAKPVVNFLTKMAYEIEVPAASTQAGKAVEMKLHGMTSSTEAKKPVFQPMRRKMHLVE